MYQLGSQGTKDGGNAHPGLWSHTDVEGPGDRVNPDGLPRNYFFPFFLPSSLPPSVHPFPLSSFLRLFPFLSLSYPPLDIPKTLN